MKKQITYLGRGLFFFFFLSAMPALAQVDTDFSAGGGMKIGTSSSACDGTIEGSIRYDSTSKKIDLCNGSAWQELISAVPSTDSTPDAFSFTDLTGQSLGTSVSSNVLNITGFDGIIQASVSGGGTPEISINGGAWITSGGINSGESLQVRLTTSGSVSTERIATVTVGSGSDNWNVTTKAGNTRIFVTTNSYNGNLGGLSGGDAICQSEAGSLGYSGTWKALLSTSVSNVKDRVTITYPVVRASDGITVIDSLNIWDGSLENAVIATASAMYTGSTSSGVYYDSDCGAWTEGSAAGRTRIGEGASTTTSWMAYGNKAYCNIARKLYCIDQ